MHACMHVGMHACMYVCTYDLMYVRMYVCMYVCMYSCMYVCMCVCRVHSLPAMMRWVQPRSLSSLRGKLKLWNSGNQASKSRLSGETSILFQPTIYGRWLMLRGSGGAALTPE